MEAPVAGGLAPPSSSPPEVASRYRATTVRYTSNSFAWVTPSSIHRSTSDLPTSSPRCSTTNSKVMSAPCSSFHRWVNSTSFTGSE